jgi:hypothetical protein
VFVPFIDRLFLEAPRDEKQAAQYVSTLIVQRGLKLARAETLVEEEAQAREALAERARAFFAELLPYYRQIGLLD